MSEKFEHKKSLGQHFLNSDFVPKKMCDAANLQVGDQVLEIGPGTGILTSELLKRGVGVVAVEADIRAIDSLKETFVEEISKGQLIIHHHDARVLEPEKFGLVNQNYKVVSNIPYYISGLLFRSLLDTKCQPNTLVFLVQKEVAARIAREKKESILSLSIKVFGDPTYICTVKRGHFTPPPNIDSAIIAVNNIGLSRLGAVTPEQFFTIIKLGFGQKRKQLLGNLSALFTREEIEKAFLKLDIENKVRAEDIPLELWVDLVTELYSSTD